MTSGYAQDGHSHATLALFKQMRMEKAVPDHFVFATIVSFCDIEMEVGKQLHAHVMLAGFHSDFVLLTVLIRMYSASAAMDDARQLFDEMSGRDIISWTAMIARYNQCGRMEDAFSLFDRMPRRDTASWNVMIAGCAQNRYGAAFFTLFCSMQRAGCGMRLNQVTYATLLIGYDKHGFAYEAIQLFDQMLKYGVKPNHITFISILSACSHAGLVEQGWRFFHSMTQDYNIEPRAEDYACMVDLLGRSRKVEEAHNLINKIPSEPGADVWVALLGACRAQGNMEIGKLAAQRLFELNPGEAGTYVELSNIYATSAL